MLESNSEGGALCTSEDASCPMAWLLLMQATLPILQCERSCLDRVGQNKARLAALKARLAALQSQDAPQPTNVGPGMGANVGRGGDKGKKRSYSQENNPQVPF